MNRYLKRKEDINKLKKEFKKQKEGGVKLKTLSEIILITVLPLLYPFYVFAHIMFLLIS